MNASKLALSFLSDQPPVLFHQLDVGFCQSGRDINPPVGNAAVDLQFRDRPAIDQDKKQTATSLDAERVERETAVFIQFKKRAVISVASRVWIKRDHVAFGQAWHTLDCDLFSGKQCPNRAGKDGGIIWVRFRVDAKYTMSIFTRDGNGEKCQNQTRENGFHDRLITLPFRV